MKKLIDSINFLASGIEFVNFRYLKMLGIKIKKYPTIDRLGNTGYGYSFIYDTVHFNYNGLYKCALIQTNTHSILKKRDITLSDKNLYKEKLTHILHTVFGNTDFNLKVERIDYYVDIPLEENEKKMYLLLFRYHMPHFGYTKLKDIYGSSVYRASKRGQYNINMYSRFEKTGLDIDKNILRIELQMKKAKIQNEFKKGIPRTIDNYWNKEAMEKYYFGFYREFLGTGTHYNISKAREIINNFELSDSWKRKLKKLLKVMKVELNHSKAVKSKQTFKNYVEKLGELDINVLCLWDSFPMHISSLPNLLDLAKAVAEAKYFK